MRHGSVPADVLEAVDFEPDLEAITEGTYTPWWAVALALEPAVIRGAV